MSMKKQVISKEVIWKDGKQYIEENLITIIKKKKSLWK